MMDDKTRDDLARAIRVILFERHQAGSYVNWEGASEPEKTKWRAAADACYNAYAVARDEAPSFRAIKDGLKCQVPPDAQNAAGAS